MTRARIEALIRRAYHEGFTDGINHKDRVELRKEDDTMIEAFLATSQPSVAFKSDLFIGQGQTPSSRSSY